MIYIVESKEPIDDSELSPVRFTEAPDVWFYFTNVDVAAYYKLMGKIVHTTNWDTRE